MMDIRNGLGESNNRTYYMALSNTNAQNTNSNFVNEPFGGLHFFESKPISPAAAAAAAARNGGVSDEEWNVQLLSASFPRHEQLEDSIIHDIWYKRLHLGEEIPASDPTLYKRMYEQGILFGNKYANKMNSLAPVRPRPDKAK